MGCVFAMIPQRTWTLAAQQVLKFSTVAAACVLGYLVSTLEFTDPIIYQWGYTGVAAVSGVLVWSAATQRSILGRVFEWGPLMWFGKISYALYLWHWLILRNTSFYYWVGETWDPWARFVSAIIISALSFYLIEQPFNKLKTRFAFDRATGSTLSNAMKRAPFRTGDVQPEKSVTISHASAGVIIQPTEQNI